ncbi:uncharacterized protein HMPREF1541_08367 [Cyphellophora europaea CBS 101466]|uniref:C6 transcription factor n=1 Tax=Cyphellophora europaea (strain CBS 101466) TaxID=1220924 RepID=W2RLL3_CYPE1|nr:uncharacterized protein HMPREF1541_08367 [Cyphellophora europaea CBS 101466]ETN37376.1 hypothetical protein HMPREF1541_08367 [Cyphellophora europaea CBS 101466]
MDAHIWQGVVTDLGLKFSFLMDVMLALSATQIAAEADSAQARSTYTSIALEYQNSAVIAARPELLNVCADNCNALFGFTILNIPTSVVLAQLPTGGEDTGKSPLESIVISSEWISCLVSLMTAAEPWLRHGPFKEAYDNCDDPEMYDETMRQPMQRLTSLLARSKYAGREYTQQFKMFSHAVELLEERAMRSRSMSIAWPAEIGDVFVQMLKERDQMALMITLHWGVVLHSLKNWWTDFTGKRLVDQISQELPRESGVAEEAVRWARIHVGLDSQET